MSGPLVQTLILFLLMAAGFAAGKLKLLDAPTGRKLSRLLVDFVLPALIVASMQRPLTPELRSEAFAALGLSFAVYAAAFPLAFGLVALLRAPKAQSGVLAFAGVFSNVAFMGFPVMTAFFGESSLFAVSVYNIPFQILAFSLGAAIIARAAGHEARLGLSSFVTPAGVASVLGLVLFLLQLRLPGPLVSAMRLLGDTTTPMSMLVIGASLSRADLKVVFRSPRVYALVAYRLLLFPLALYGVLRLLGLSGSLLAMPVVIASMPVAANTSLLAEASGGDGETASALVFLSTALSVLTIPALAAVLFGL